VTSWRTDPRPAHHHPPRETPPRRTTGSVRTDRWVALAAPGHQHTRQDHAVPRSPPPITRPRGRQHSHRQANRPRTPTLHLDRDQPSLVPGRDHRLRPAVLATAALPAWNTGQRRTEDPALPALLHTAARIVRGQRKHTIRIPGTWPWASQLATCLRATFALPHQLDVDQHKPAPTTAPTPGPWNPALTQRDSRASNPNSTLTTTSTTIMKITSGNRKPHPSTRE